MLLGVLVASNLGDLEHIFKYIKHAKKTNSIYSDSIGDMSRIHA
jgi:hypothetical protein